MQNCVAVWGGGGGGGGESGVDERMDERICPFFTPI